MYEKVTSVISWNCPTVQCLSTITEIINYYIKNSSNLYMCTLDCTKAFDRVIGYEPAGLTVHPPPQNNRGWVHFFRMGV